MEFLANDEDNQNIEATEARPPRVDVVKRARQMAKKLALNLEAKCLEEARTGKRAAEWSSGDIHGLGREAGEALLSEFAHEVQKMEFTEVEWWRGPVIGWTPEAGAASLDTDETRPIPWKQFGSWGLALKLRVSWEAEARRPPREPRELQKQTRSQLNQTRGQSDFSDIDSERSDFSVSPRPIRSVSHSRPSACIVCHDNRHRQAKLLPCGHRFCRYCARRLRGRPCVNAGPFVQMFQTWRQTWIVQIVPRATMKCLMESNGRIMEATKGLRRCHHRLGARVASNHCGHLPDERRAHTARVQRG